MEADLHDEHETEFDVVQNISEGLGCEILEVEEHIQQEVMDTQTTETNAEENNSFVSTSQSSRKHWKKLLGKMTKCTLVFMSLPTWKVFLMQFCVFKCNTLNLINLSG